MDGQQQPPPGWYPVPGQPHLRDWWSGTAWAGTPVPAEGTASVPGQSGPPTAGWIRRHKVLAGTGAAIGVFLLLGVIGQLTGAGTPTDHVAGAAATTDTTQTVPAATETATPSPSLYTPTPADFRVTLKILKRDCFGSAGCNVVYRIAPDYTGKNLTADQSFTITYTVKGGDDPQQGSFTLTGMRAEFDSESMISTGSSKAKLSIHVDEVIPN